MPKMITKKTRVRRLINGKWIAEARRGIWPIRWWSILNCYSRFQEPWWHYTEQFDNESAAEDIVIGYLARRGIEYPIDPPAPIPAKESISRPAFITGSRALGIANSESDIDVVIMVSKDEEDRLKEMSGGRFPIRFGSLNLVTVTSEAEYDAWRDSLQKLKELQKANGDWIPKDVRVNVHKEMLQKYGIQHWSQKYQGAQTCT